MDTSIDPFATSSSPPSKRLLTFNIEYLNHKFTLHIPDNELVYKIKELIEERLNIPAKFLKLNGWLNKSMYINDKMKLNELNLPLETSLYALNTSEIEADVHKLSSNSLKKNKIDLFPNLSFEVTNESKSTQKSLKEKLFDLYLQENKNMTNANQTELKYLNYSTNLLEKLVKNENFNTIVLNFYSANQGYSLGFNIKTNDSKSSSNHDTNNNNCNKKEFNKTDISSLNKIETKLLSYDETDLLFYINTGEIPPILIDLVDHLNVNLFYDGCLVLEIRDFRRKLQSHSTTNFIQNQHEYDLNFVLLQPSMQTLLADINSITNNGQFVWTQEDKYALESQLLLATSQPLCLDPNPIVSIIKNKIHSSKHKLSSRSIKKFALRYSESYKNRVTRLQEYALPYPFRILKIRKKCENTNEHDYLNKLNEIKLLKQELQSCTNGLVQDTNLNNQKLSSPISNINFHSIDNWSKSSHEFKLPSDDMILVKKFAKTIEHPKYSNEPILNSIEEIILEAMDKTSKNNYSKLLIKRRCDDGAYFCQLSLRNDHKNEVLFRLGTATEAEKYIQQYVKIFTEEGRRPVTIKHNLLEKLNQSNSVNDQKNVLVNENSKQTSLLLNGSNSTLKKPVNTSPVLTGFAFQNFFDSKNPINFNDKQLQSYQTFLQQQFQQQKLQQLEQLRRAKSTSEEALNNSSSNLKNLIQASSSSNTSSSANQSTQNPNTANSLTPSAKVYANIQPAKSNTQNEPIMQRSILAKKQSDPQITATTSTQITSVTSSSVATTSSSASTSMQSLIPIKTDESGSASLQYQPITTTKINSNTSLSSSSSSTACSQNNSFIQIYVPKLVSSTSSSSVLNSPANSKILSSPTLNAQNSLVLGNSQNFSSLKIPISISNNSQNAQNSNPKKQKIQTKTGQATKRQPKKRANSSTTTPITNRSQINLAPKAIQSKSSNEPEKQKVKQSATNTKIINASNLSVLKKIAIDSRVMPVIVTLNSNDPSSHEQQQHVKLTIKTNQEENSPGKGTSGSYLASSHQSPIKTTVQLMQKSTPYLNQNKINLNQNTEVASSLLTPVASLCSPNKLKEQSEISAVNRQEQMNKCVLASTVKTIPINQNQFSSKTAAQSFFATSSLIENHPQFLSNKSNSNNHGQQQQQSPSLILLTNSTNSNAKFIQSDNSKS